MVGRGWQSQQLRLHATELGQRGRGEDAGGRGAGGDGVEGRVLGTGRGSGTGVGGVREAGRETRGWLESVQGWLNWKGWWGWAGCFGAGSESGSEAEVRWGAWERGGAGIVAGWNLAMPLHRCTYHDPTPLPTCIISATYKDYTCCIIILTQMVFS